VRSSFSLAGISGDHDDVIDTTGHLLVALQCTTSYRKMALRHQHNACACIALPGALLHPGRVPPIKRCQTFRATCKRLALLCSSVEGAGRWKRQPHFPHLPVDAPLTYVLAFKACLSDDPAERPSFEDLIVLLDDEVVSGSYINSAGKTKARPSQLLGTSRVARPRSCCV
jgi:hypothetical protein